jgi:hypothetical protein
MVAGDGNEDGRRKTKNRMSKNRIDYLPWTRSFAGIVGLTMTQGNGIIPM